MSEKRIMDLVNSAIEAASNVIVPGTNITLTRKEMLESVGVLERLMSTSGNKPDVGINLKEALWSADASVLFPKVYNNILLRPKEPLMFGQTTLAKTIQVDNVRLIEFPTIGAVRAADVADGQEYPEVQPAFGEVMTEVKTNKSGVAVSVSEDVVANSMWDVLALYVEAAGFAMMRWKEEKIFREFQAKAQVVCDNDLGGLYLTTGTNTSGETNGTLTYNDIIDAISSLIANEYIPTDIIMHPLAWAIFAKDPVLRYQLMNSGSVNSTYGNMGPNAVAANLPWNINVVVSPFVPFTTTSVVSTLAASGTELTTTPDTDIYICDRNNGIVILQSEAMQTAEWNDPRRDIQYIKFKEKYGIGLLNGGKSAVSLKNVRITQNYEALYSIITRSA